MSTPPFTVLAEYAYTSPEEDDLQFEEGQIITVESIEDEEWYYGSYVDASGNKLTGIFPQNFVSPYTQSETATSGEDYVETSAVETSQPQDAEPQSVKPVEPIEQVDPVQTASTLPPVPVPVPVPAPTTVKPPTSPPKSSSPSRFSSSPDDLPASEASASTDSSEPKPAKKKNAFADRIAAFNNSSQAPLTPFSAPKPSSYARKPFVAAPSNHYVPQLPPSIPAASSYQARSQSPPPGNIVHRDDPEEEEHEPVVSLRERIKLLQKQQEEEQARMEALANKKKHKAKPKHEPVEASEEPGSGSLEPVTSSGSAQTQHRPSIDLVHPTGSSENVESQTLEDQAQHPLAQPLSSVDGLLENDHSQVTKEIEQDDEEEEEEEEEDEEEARRIALRNRMAKISGGMGMVGMMGGFGFPGAMPGAVPKPKKTKKVEAEDHPEVHQAPVPIFPFADPKAIPSGLNFGHPKPEIEEKKEKDEVIKNHEEQEKDLDVQVVHETGVDSQLGREAVEAPAGKEKDLDDEIEQIPVQSKFAAHEEPVSTHSPTAPISTPNQVPVPVAVPSTLDPAAASLAPNPSTTSAPPPTSFPAAPARTDLVSVIDSYRSDSEDEGSDSAWGDDDDKPTQHIAHAAPSVGAVAPTTRNINSTDISVSESRSVPPPPPPSAATTASSGLDSQSESFTEPNTSSALGGKETHKEVPQKEPFSLNSGANSLDYDETAEEALGDDEQTESEDNRQVNPHQATSTIPSVSSVSSIPSIPPVPLATSVPTASSALAEPELTSSQDTHHHHHHHRHHHHSPPPPPPNTASTSSASGIHLSSPVGPPPSSIAPGSGAAIGIPSRSLALQSPVGYPSEDVAGYEADEDTDVNKAPSVVSASSPLVKTTLEPSLDAKERDLDNEAGTGSAIHSQHLPPTASEVPSEQQDFERRPLPQKIEQLPYTIDLSNETGPWWSTEERAPHSLLDRKDVLYEVDTQTLSKRHNRTVIVHDIYILFPDYSQEIITAEYSPQAPSTEPATITRRRIEPPAPLSPESLKTASEHYGKQVLDILTQSPPPSSLSEIVSRVRGALPPVGPFSYGALVYFNNGTSVRQFDEIRPGDVVTLQTNESEGVVCQYDNGAEQMGVWLPQEGRVVTVGVARPTGETKVFRVVGRDFVGW